MGFAPRAPGLDYAAFQAHWKGEHGGLAAQIPGLRGYIQNHAVLRGGRPLLPYVGFDACSEILFDSLHSMDEGFASEHYQSQVVADEHVLIDKARFGLFLAERRVLREGAAPEGAVKLLTFLPVDPRSSRAALAELAAGAYAEAVAGVGIRHEQLVEIPGAHEGRLPPLFSVVDILWFSSPDDALAFVQGDGGDRVGWLLAGTAFGLQRLLAEPVVVA
jgi:uncharacterized protein (TIGR02118 family)